VLKKNWQKIIYIFLTALLIYLPFQVFAQEFLSSVIRLSPSVSFWLAHWYEVFILVIFVITFFRKASVQTKRPMWQVASFCIILLGFGSIFLFSKAVGRGIEGFRIDLFFILGLFIARNLTADFSTKLIKTYLLLSVLISVWALLERFLPIHYWQKVFNFSTDFGFGNYFVGTTPRSDSIFNGPSQLSNYLLPAAGLLIFEIKKNAKPNWQKYLYYFVILLAIGFAYSRAAWLGLITLVVLMTIFTVKNWPLRGKILLITVLALAIPLFSVRTETGSISTAVLTHDTSQESHVIAAETTVTEVKKRLYQPLKLFFGSGLSSAGPLVLKYHDGLISESWYLQILLELGVVGLAFWIWLMAALFIDMIKRNAGLAYGLVAVSIAALFLHTFADSPTTSWTLFALIGANLGKHNEENFN